MATVLITALSAAIAWADGSDEAYREAYKLGTELFDKGKWPEAREQFQKAYNIEPKPLLLFNIGSTYRREGNYIEALFYYHRYLEEAPADAEYRGFAEKVIADLSAKIEAEKAAGKTASTQGQKSNIQKSDTQKSNTQKSNTQKSNTQKSNTQKSDTQKSNTQKSDTQKSDNQKSDTQPGNRQRADQAGLVSGSGESAGQSSSGLKYTGLAIMVAGVAGLGWGGYEAWRADQLASDLGQLPMGTPWTPELQSEYQRGEAADTRAKIALAAGGAAVVIGGALYLIGRRGSGNRGESRSLALGPRLGPQSIGVIVHASF